MKVSDYLQKMGVLYLQKKFTKSDLKEITEMEDYDPLVFNTAHSIYLKTIGGLDSRFIDKEDLKKIIDLNYEFEYNLTNNLENKLCTKLAKFHSVKFYQHLIKDLKLKQDWSINICIK